MIWPDDFIDKVITGDCREVVADIPNGVIDAIITDPVWPI
jgi:predicted methyltransferase